MNIQTKIQMCRITYAIAEKRGPLEVKEPPVESV